MTTVNTQNTTVLQFTTVNTLNTTVLKMNTNSTKYKIIQSTNNIPIIITTESNTTNPGNITTNNNNAIISKRTTNNTQSTNIKNYKNPILRSNDNTNPEKSVINNKTHIPESFNSTKINTISNIKDNNFISLNSIIITETYSNTNITQNNTNNIKTKNPVAKSLYFRIHKYYI